MVSRFDQRFRTQAFPLLQQEFGEPVVYRFRGGGKRFFNAIIVRNPPAFYNAAGDVIQPEYEIRFPNDSCCGATAKEIDIADSIDIIPELGGSEVREVTVLKLLSQDSGVCVVACKG